MKTKILLITIFTLVITANYLIAQNRTDYTVEGVAGHQVGTGTIKSISSTYWYGDTWVFQWFHSTAMNELGYFLEYSSLEIDSDGYIENSYSNSFFNQGLDLYIEPHVSSCVFNKSLFVFFYDKDDEEINNIYFWTKDMQSEFRYNSVPISEETTKQMAAVAANDTLYIFFVDKADRKVKYYRGLYKAHQYNAPDIEWISSTPTILSHTILPIGNVSACSYTDDYNKEKIMVAFAGDLSKGTNEVNLFTGIQDNFEIYKQIQTPSGKHAEDVAIEQGSIKGGDKQGYIFQVGYSKTELGENKGPIRCEINMDTGDHSDWEITEIVDGEYIPSQLTGFMTYYNKGAFKREKHLYQMFPIAYRPDIWAIHWESDKLIYNKSIEQVPPITHASNFYDLVAVVEGAPPYALNGWKLGDQGTSINIASTFDFQKSTETTVATTTTYKQSIAVNMGYGPVTAGFKASFMESSGTSTSKSLSIDEIIHPPLANNDSVGVMFYYYVAPTVKRSEWNLCDYDGDTLLKSRNIFFFTFESPQLKTLTYPLKHFSDSPNADSLGSYDRNVQNMNGMKMLIRNELDLDISQGGTASLDLAFSETKKYDHNESFTVSLGIEGEYEIFSASVEAEAEFEYTRERETKCEKSFHIGWDNPVPKTQHDTNNIKQYTVVSYVMETTDSNAYYLLEGFKNYNPIFITYEVHNIVKGAFGHESIDENLIFIKKYQFSNYPNPCSDESKFTYVLTDRSHVNLTVYNTYGQKIGTPLNEVQTNGNHQFDLKTLGFSGGVYYYRMLIGKDLIMGKIIKR